jgi:hypothetical protein
LKLVWRQNRVKLFALPVKAPDPLKVTSTNFNITYQSLIIFSNRNAFDDP